MENKFLETKHSFLVFMLDGEEYVMTADKILCVLTVEQIELFVFNTDFYKE